MGSVFYILPGDDSCCSPSASVSPIMQDLFYRNSNSMSYVTYTNYTEVKAYWGRSDCDFILLHILSKTIHLVLMKFVLWVSTKHCRLNLILVHIVQV